MHVWVVYQVLSDEGLTLVWHLPAVWILKVCSCLVSPVHVEWWSVVPDLAAVGNERWLQPSDYFGVCGPFAWVEAFPRLGCP